MTVRKLIKLLEELARSHGDRTPVVVDHHEIRASCGNFADDCSIGEIKSITTEYVYRADDDGGIAVNKDGSERGRICIVLGNSQ